MIVPKFVAKSAQAFRGLLARHGVTVLNQTTLAFDQLTRTVADASNATDDLVVRAVIFGGEACPPDLAAAWKTQCRVLHAYGPTESTVFATMATALTGEAVPPIGAPIANTRVYVLDGDLRPCPVGVVGELYIAGPGLARGYWGRPGLTAERFVANPFAIEPGERLYRSGDLAAWRPDGNLLFHGRSDQQLKIRGFRIEPGEIEATLVSEPGIAQAAVNALQDAAGDRRLVAYLVPGKDAQERTVTIDLRALRQNLATQLPEYMVPTAFVVLNALPLTSNGKLDRKALPAPDGSGLAAPYVAPATPEQMLLCDLVGELLGVEQAGLTDNFFHLGGHSLMAARLTAQVRTRLGRELPIHTIFQYPVLQELAQQIGLLTDSHTVFDVLLPIRTTGSLPPLFCLHPGAGLCWSYTNLLRAIPEEQPIYGIQARGFAGDPKLPGTLDEIVEESVGRIRGVRARGPYRLLGWSFGGIIAHLIATRLQSEGEQIERLFIFDSYPPEPLLENQTILTKSIDAIWREIVLGANLIIPPQEDNRGLNADTIFALAREQSHILGTFSIQQLDQLAAVMANNSRLISTAKLKMFHGDITLFVATRQTPGLQRSNISPEAWRPFCHGTVCQICIDAEHHQMLLPEALRQTDGSLL